VELAALLSIKEWWSNWNVFKLLRFTQQYSKVLRGGKNCYIYFVDNLLLFPTVKEFL